MSEQAKKPASGAGYSGTPYSRELLDYVYTRLHIVDKSLDDMLAIPVLRIPLINMARREIERRARIDLKKLQANDKE